MAEHSAPTQDNFEDDPRVQRLLGFLRDGPLPRPRAEAIHRAKAIGARNQMQTPGALQQSIEFIAQLIFDSRATPALAGFRSAINKARLLYATDAGEVEIQIEPPPPGQKEAGQELVNILGHVESEQTARAACLHLPDDTPVVEAAIDEHGMFSLAVPSGSYQLTITLDRSTMKISSLDL